MLFIGRLEKKPTKFVVPKKERLGLGRMRKSTESEILLRRRSRRCRRRRRHPSVTRTHSIDKKAEAEVF